MTMPHLMNCGHIPNGWCLDCVGKLWREKQETESILNTIKVTVETLTNPKLRDKKNEYSRDCA